MAEADRIAARPIARLMAAAAAVVLSAVAGVLLWLHGHALPAGGERFATPLQLPPQPRLQSAPQPDLAAERAEQHQRLQARGWVDAASGVARIPIDDAMALMAARAACAASSPPCHPERSEGSASSSKGSLPQDPSLRSRMTKVSLRMQPGETTQAPTAPPTFAGLDEHPPSAGLDEHPGASVPLALPFTDSDGRTAPLHDWLAARPVLLVPGDFRCPQLCGLLMQGLLEALHLSGAGPSRILRVAIDPSETQASAAARRAADLRYAAWQGFTPDLQLLRADAPTLHALLQSIGWRYSELTPTPDDPLARFAHPAVVVVLTPQGRVSRYLGGVRFEPQDIATAIDDAAAGRIHEQPGVLALLCAHFDPRWGRHSAAVLAWVRGAAIATVLGLAALALRRRHRP